MDGDNDSGGDRGDAAGDSYHGSYLDDCDDARSSDNYEVRLMMVL